MWKVPRVRRKEGKDRMLKITNTEGMGEGRRARTGDRRGVPGRKEEI